MGFFAVQSRQSAGHQVVSTSRGRNPRRQDPSRFFPSEPERVGISDDWIGEAGWALVIHHNLEPVLGHFPVARGFSCYILIGFKSNRLLPTPDVGRWRAEKAELCGKAYPEAEQMRKMAWRSTSEQNQTKHLLSGGTSISVSRAGGSLQPWTRAILSQTPRPLPILTRLYNACPSPIKFLSPNARFDSSCHNNLRISRSETALHNGKTRIPIINCHGQGGPF